MPDMVDTLDMEKGGPEPAFSLSLSHQLAGGVVHPEQAYVACHDVPANLDGGLHVHREPFSRFVCFSRFVPEPHLQLLLVND